MDSKALDRRGRIDEGTCPDVQRDTKKGQTRTQGEEGQANEEAMNNKWTRE